MNKVILCTFLALMGFVSAAFSSETGRLYSCELGGTSGTYKRAEIDQIISIGGKCSVLHQGETITCAVGKVRRRYARNDIDVILAENPNAVCQENGKLLVKTKNNTTSKSRKITNTLYVFFKLNQSDTNPLNTEAIIAFAKRNAGSGAWFTITAYADRSGGQQYNLTLSTRRAGTVKVKLLEYGIKRSSILSVSSMGENAPPIATKDGKRKASNRVVIVRAYR